MLRVCDKNGYRQDVEHVAEAIRLFKVSTGHAANSGSMAAEGFLRPEMATQIQEVEDQIKRRVAIGSDARVKRLVTVSTATFGTTETNGSDCVTFVEDTTCDGSVRWCDINFPSVR